MPRLALALPVFVLGLIARPAHGQQAGNFELDSFHPAIDSRGYLTLNASQVLDDKELSFGLGSLEWGRHLLAFQNGAASYSVDNVISATLVAALGLRVGGVPFELGASLPFTIMNGARGPDMIDAANPNDTTRYRLDGQGLGDMGLHLKARLAHVGPLGVGAIASVFLPTTTPRDRFLGEPTVTPQLMAIADVQAGRLRLALNGGVRLRHTSSFTDMGGMGALATMGTITASTELPVGIGAAWALAPEKLELIGEVFGAVPVGKSAGYQPLEALGGIKVYLAKSSYLSLGAGRGLLPNQAGNPDFRAVIGIVFEPKSAERVSTVIPDEVVAEAPPPPKPDDGFHDRDNDGIDDKDDLCPDEPENYNGIKDWDGCPELAIDVGSKIVALRSIEFEYDSAVLRRSAYEVLDAVVGSLTDNPDIQLVEIQGHTDERGDDDYNFDLSNRRAASVMDYMTKHGIAANRLEAQGYGETQPIDKAHNEQAWSKNRRVEFIIQKRSGI